ncbi:linker for activation of T-cells family member 2 isoform X1 [Callorhinchus milii]|uniref:linker for activation of T-cells family member 2 isoform X1 n=1 Tax=Callorhinchus milii TaxID=7868 RepID=UPI0004573C19|nr:linker for activation of T-cells family member 2 isoform X1 [Callorhinchus milii]|eukprot:gi/632975653/ref/XP_007904347.1/ PREDICTED: linker for activation of T-cells family member 2 [Callorhinchus milii]
MYQGQLWWGILSVLPLGILVTLCARCRRTRGRTVIREETRRKGRSVHGNEDKKQFEVVRSYTVTRQDHGPRPPAPLPETTTISTISEFTVHPGVDISPNYENILIGNELDLEETYVNPIASDYGFPQKCFHPSDEDANDYENLSESRTSLANYGNAVYIERWKHPPDDKDLCNTKPQSQIHGSSLAKADGDEDDDDDDEPDYVNTVPC